MGCCRVLNRPFAGRFFGPPHNPSSTVWPPIDYRGKAPDGSWWLQYYHPRSGKLDRFSLTTSDRCAEEVLHHFAEVLLKIGMMEPGHFHCPNPIAALPSYMAKGKQRIIFLRPGQVDEQLATVSLHPALRAGVMIMIEAGLRRSEALWLTRDALPLTSLSFA